jgi:serine protease AprX
MARHHPGWRRRDGACPACVQELLLELLRERGEDALLESVQRAWPLDAEAAFGALPTPLRLRADPGFRGRRTTLALVDSGSFPHPDLVRPRNRVKVWADASGEAVRELRFAADETPRWPGWDHQRPRQWHGLMTSVAAAGNGFLAHGLYRGLASEAELVLVQVAGADGRIGNPAIARALHWLERHAEELGLSVVSLSLGGDVVEPLRGNPVDEAVAALVRRGVVVVAAAGNDGVRRLVPPGTAPEAITVGGLDDRSLLDPAQRELWHSNYGEASDGTAKPELVAPSLWVVAPVLPHTALAQEAQGLFERRAAGDPAVELRIRELKLVTPFYQHVEGTSFAAPVVASLVACLREAAPGLSPAGVARLLCATARRVPGAPPERQGAGAVDAGKAIATALALQRAA